MNKMLELRRKFHELYLKYEKAEEESDEYYVLQDKMRKLDLEIKILREEKKAPK